VISGLLNYAIANDLDWPSKLFQLFLPENKCGLRFRSLTESPGGLTKDEIERPLKVILYYKRFYCLYLKKYIVITRRWHVMMSCQPDGRPPQPVRPWKSGRVHLAEVSNVVVLEQEIRSVKLGVCPMQLFHFLITSWKSDGFTLKDGDISIFKMAAVRHLGIVLPPYKTTHEVPVKCYVNLIHRSEDIAVWIFRIFGLKCPFNSPKLGFWGTLDP